jgi:D-serine deaminase-like pyridoxal phosphate-dependent protein
MGTVNPLDDTPVVRIDLDAVERNIARMQSLADAGGLALRPHIKTHKLPLIAHKQLRAGAVGIACQKLGEAEVMAAAGIEQILVTFPLVGEPKWTRAARLAREIELAIALDSDQALEGVAAAAATSRAEVAVLVDCDIGRWRTGVPDPARALELAQLAERLPGVRFGGLFAHPWPEEAAAWVAEARGLFAADGVEIPLVSLGGTLEANHAKPLEGIATELRAGTYAYGDRACLSAGVTPLEDCAMRIRATVVSTPTPERAILDTGSKTLTSDNAEGVDDGLFGTILDQPGALLTMLSEEHGHVDLTGAPGSLQIGQTVELLPNHACGVTNLHDVVQLHRSDQYVGSIEVAARGRIR